MFEKCQIIYYVYERLLKIVGHQKAWRHKLYCPTKKHKSLQDIVKKVNEKNVIQNVIVRDIFNVKDVQDMVI